MLRHQERIFKIKNIISHIDEHFATPHEILYLKRALATGLLRLVNVDPDNNEDCEAERAADALDLILAELEEFF